MKSRFTPILLNLTATMAVASSCQPSSQNLQPNFGPQPKLLQNPNTQPRTEGGFSIKDYPQISTISIPFTIVPMHEGAVSYLLSEVNFQASISGVPIEVRNSLADFMPYGYAAIGGRAKFTDLKTNPINGEQYASKARIEFGKGELTAPYIDPDGKFSVAPGFGVEIPFVSTDGKTYTLDPNYVNEGYMFYGVFQQTRHTGFYNTYYDHTKYGYNGYKEEFRAGGLSNGSVTPDYFPSRNIQSASLIVDTIGHTLSCSVSLGGTGIIDVYSPAYSTHPLTQRTGSFTASFNFKTNFPFATQTPSPTPTPQSTPPVIIPGGGGGIAGLPPPPKAPVAKSLLRGKCQKNGYTLNLAYDFDPAGPDLTLIVTPSKTGTVQEDLSDVYVTSDKTGGQRSDDLLHRTNPGNTENTAIREAWAKHIDPKYAAEMFKSRSTIDQYRNEGNRIYDALVRQDGTSRTLTIHKGKESTFLPDSPGLYTIANDLKNENLPLQTWRPSNEYKPTTLMVGLDLDKGGQYGPDNLTKILEPKQGKNTAKLKVKLPNGDVDVTLIMKSKSIVKDPKTGELHYKAKWEVRCG